jgi:hypothetical protein
VAFFRFFPAPFEAACGFPFFRLGAALDFFFPREIFAIFDNFAEFRTGFAMPDVAPEHRGSKAKIYRLQVKQRRIGSHS